MYSQIRIMIKKTEWIDIFFIIYIGASSGYCFATSYSIVYQQQQYVEETNQLDKNSNSKQKKTNWKQHCSCCRKKRKIASSAGSRIDTPYVAHAYDLFSEQWSDQLCIWYMVYSSQPNSVIVLLCSTWLGCAQCVHLHSFWTKFNFKILVFNLIGRNWCSYKFTNFSRFF